MYRRVASIRPPIVLAARKRKVVSGMTLAEDRRLVLRPSGLENVITGILVTPSLTSRSAVGNVETNAKSNINKRSGSPHFF
jgi:hypothetical protein